MRNIKYYLITIVLIVFILNTELIMSSVIKSSTIFFNNIFSTIFPFMILSDILIYYNYHIFLSKNIGKILAKIFNISKESTIVIILSMLSSTPTNAIVINNLIDNNSISKYEAKRILVFTSFPSISFVIGFIGIKLYNSFNIGLLLLLNNYLCNLLIGIFLRDKTFINTNYLTTNNQKNLFTIIKQSIIKSINTCFIILGNITIFIILINIIDKYLMIDNIISSLIYGLIEMTNGILLINKNITSINIKLFLTSFIINFNGLSIILQTISIINNIKLDIKKILIIKLIFSFLTALLFLL